MNNQIAKYIYRFLIIFGFSLKGFCSDIESKLPVLEKQVENSFQQLDEKSIGNIEQVKDQLKIMYTLDQMIRKEAIAFKMNAKFKNLLEKMDRFHTQHLKKILAIYGWITLTKFGNEADNQAWLLVQHADHNPHFQASCLFILQHLVPLKETDVKNYAYLYDRVALKYQNLGFKQKYGTQVEQKGNKWKLLPFEGTLKDVDLDRQKVGLEPIENYLNFIKSVYDK
ncbi:MAG: hypothetical protein FJX71_01545 [Alphaproteobacteria bacterium]|nr:hypothetical protein [Alphaproteobacteria bacterium]